MQTAKHHDGRRRTGSALDEGLAWLEGHRYWVLGALVLWMLLGVNGQWRLAPDTAIYATIGRNVVEGKGFVHPSSDPSRAWPGIVGLFAANFWLFGTEVLWPVVLVMAGVGLGVLGLTYRLIAIHADRGQAVATTVLLGVCATFYVQTLDVMADLPFLAGLMAFLVGYEQREQGLGSRWTNAAWLMGGFLCMAGFKITVLIVGAAWLGAQAWKSLREPKRRWAVCLPLVGLLILVGFRVFDPLGFASSGPGVKEQTIVYQLWQRLGVTLSSIAPENALELLGQTLPEAVFGNQFLIDPITIGLSVIVLGTAFVLFAHRLLWGLLVLGFVFQWLMFFPSGRYMLVLMPLLAFAWWRHAVRMSRFAPPWLGWGLCLGALVLWIGMNGPRTIGIMINQHRRPFQTHYEHGRFEGLTEIGHWLGEHTPAQSIVLTKRKWVAPLIFYSRRQVRFADRPQVEAAAQTSKPLFVIRTRKGRLGWPLLDADLEQGPCVFELPRRGSKTPLIVQRVFREGHEQAAKAEAEPRASDCVAMRRGEPVGHQAETVVEGTRSHKANGDL